MAGESVQLEIGNVLQGISRHVNCLSEDDRNIRKRALQSIVKETVDKNPPLSEDVLQGVLSEIIKPVLKILSDPVEKCREFAITLLTKSIKRVSNPEQFLPYIIPVVLQRLGQQEITEPSEELRLSLVELLQIIVDISKENLAAYLDDFIKILQRTIVDPFPEVKKESCKCASSLAKKIPAYFHQQSESLIKPLQLSISHQHYRVRVEVIRAIGNVIQYGNNKSVDDVVSHLAQRVFDQSPPVRTAVTEVIGGWLLDLPDRYSFFHKLIPLMLTMLQDEIPEIQTKADALWHDIGLKYASENENDLKDKQDFVKPEPTHYPKNIERPNIGCRELVYRNFSKILPGLLRDIGDWVVATRIKSAQLLYTMILNNEDNVTQHMEKMLAGMYRACADEEQEVVKYVVMSAELVGYFVSPEVWCKMVLQNIKLTQSYSSLMVLAAIIRGSECDKLKAFLKDICSVLTDSQVCALADSKVQVQLLACVEALLNVCGSQCSDVSLDLFTILINVLAQCRTEEIQKKAYFLLDELAKVNDMDSRQNLYERHTQEVILSLQDTYALWTQHSTERLVFDTLLIESGPVVGEILEDVIPMLVENLKPDKDPEVKLKCFSLLSRLMMNAPQTLNSQQRFGEFAVVVVKDMVIPNCVWKAGRTAGALRTTAVSCLWALLKSEILTKERILPVVDDLMTQLRSLLEDDVKNTRLITCRAMTHLFNLVGTDLDQDKVYNFYPDLLKRLDDSSDDIRIAVTKTFAAYMNCFKDGYNVNLYRLHLEAIYKGLLVHLDDPEKSIQEAVLEVLISSARILPEMLMKEIDEVKHKHRSTKYCDILVGHIHNLNKS